MFLVHPPGLTFHNKVVDLIYKLIFRGLKTLAFRGVSYFALVFASQMLVLEYYAEHAMVQKMLDFLLHRFLVLHAVAFLDADFEALFASRELPRDENRFAGNAPRAAPSVGFELNPSLDVRGAVRSVNLRVVDLLNQISFCRAKVIDELIKVKVVDRARESGAPPKAELKKRFFRIEELKERCLVDLLLLARKQTKPGQGLRLYNNLGSLRNFLVGENAHLRSALRFALSLPGIS